MLVSQLGSYAFRFVFEYQLQLGSTYVCRFHAIDTDVSKQTIANIIENYYQSYYRGADVENCSVVCYAPQSALDVWNRHMHFAAIQINALISRNAACIAAIASV